MGRKRFGSSHLTGRLLEYKPLLKRLRQQHNPRIRAASGEPKASFVSRLPRPPVQERVTDYSNILDAMKSYCDDIVFCPINNSLGDYCILGNYCYGRSMGGIQFKEGAENDPLVAHTLRRRGYLD